MTLMHQKQTIEDTVVDQVLHWDKERPIGVYLTSGYGPPLRWTLHEFKPRTDDLLGQFQYLQDPATGQQRRFHKYSPPFGLLKLDNSDDDYLNGYLEKLLTEEWLWDLGWTCFEEESQIDEEHFQARLVDLICTLFLRSPDQVVSEDYYSYLSCTNNVAAQEIAGRYTANADHHLYYGSHSYHCRGNTTSRTRRYKILGERAKPAVHLP